MKLMTIAFVIATTLFKLVQPGCHYIGFNTPDFTPLCKDWWDKGLGYTNSDSDRKSCVSLIIKKCPSMIISETTFDRSYNLLLSRYETWTTEVKASLAKEPGTSMKYYKHSRQPLCSYNIRQDKSKNCDYWWKVSSEPQLEDTYKDSCIKQIIDYCKSSIRKIEEKHVRTVERNRRVYDVNTVTYEYNNEKVTYNHHVRL